ncbi:MAG: 50S ribosomal protein L6, partial [Synergistota bacterium]|nr:50S ribosomal protein L6 [Synergistota bacterium]
MSRIGRKPITLPDGVSLSVSEGKISVKGPRGELSADMAPGGDIAVEDGVVRVSRQNEEKKTRAFHGMIRAIVNNHVVGVSQGYERVLEIVGIG